MKKNLIRIFATLALTAGVTFVNYTGDDIVLEDGTTIVTENLEQHLTHRYKDRYIDTVTIYLHHTVTRKKATIEEINKIHLRNGWEKLSYHVVINYKGEVNLVNDFNTYSYHTKGKNKKGIAIALVGNYELEEPSKEMIKSTRNIIDIICKLPNLHVEAIKGHKDVKATLCPGKYAYKEFKNIFY